MACDLCAAGPAGSSRAPGAAGTDFAGVVRKVGARVQHLKPGSAVFGRQAPARLVEGHSGTLAEWCVVDARDCAHKPSNMTHEQAAAVPSAGLAAWSALALGELVEREEANRVVVIGAAGGVGTLAVQIAKRHFGARVVAVCGLRHFALVKSLGADEALDHAARGLRRRCAHLRNFDLVIDCVGLDRRAQPLPPPHAASPSFLLSASLAPQSPSARMWWPGVAFAFTMALVFRGLLMPAPAPASGTGRSLGARCWGAAGGMWR
jgi:NADPH:quinone reductase-like Zn-dependent oxidoreductase